MSTSIENENNVTVIQDSKEILTTNEPEQRSVEFTRRSISFRGFSLELIQQQQQQR